MRHFDSILFIYNNQDRLEYQLYAECLRMMGVYVCENVTDIRRQEIGVENWDDIDFSVRYRIEASENGNNAENRMTEHNLLERKLGLFQTSLKELLVRNEIAHEDFLSCYDVISNVFIEYDLLQASTVLQYFMMKVPEVLNAGACFEKAADRITDIMVSQGIWKNNRYMNYAGLYCEQKANLSRFLWGEPVIYYVDKLASRALRLAVTFSDFSNAWVLLGLICERKKSYIRETIDAYQRAIDAIEDKPYASSVYYRLGKCYEGESKQINAYAKEQYEKAYHSMKKYRNIYKMAVSYMNEFDYQEANEYFLECIRQLEYKGDFLDPLEQEYYFKVSVHISYCYLQQRDFYNALNYANRAIEFQQKLLDDSCIMEFYRILYGDEAEQYRNLTVHGMGCKQAVQYKRIAESELGVVKTGKNNI